jgi:peptide/nickel transport system ATP-binding protein
VRGAKIAFIPQEPAQALNPVLTVGVQLTDIVRAHLSLDRKAARKASEQSLADVGLSPVDRIYSSYPHQLSGGQRQRVTIAQALLCGPSLLIADEPTSSLDPIVQREVLCLIRSLQQRHGFSLLLISHDPYVVAEMVERIVVLRQGRIVDSGSRDEIFSPSASVYTRSLLGGPAEAAYVG